MAYNTRSRINKNKKKSWKKIDIKDVEDFLEDQRLQERTGGLVAEKTDDQLFVVDKTLDAVKDTTPTDIQKRKRQPKPLKCHANLEPNPNIKPARIKHNENLNKLEKRHKEVVAKLQSNKLTYLQIRAQQQRRTAINQRKDKRRVKRGLTTATYDLWEEPDSNSKEDSHYLVETRKRRVQVPKHYLKKPSELPAIEVPGPGASYNPAYDDHQKLLQTAHNTEVKKVRQERKLYNSMEAKFPESTWNSIETNWLDEMSAGLVNDEEEMQTFTPEELDKLSVNPPVCRDNIKPERKRKREKLQKKEVKKKLKETVKKVRERDVYRLKSLKREVVSEEKSRLEKAKLRAEKRALVKDRTRKLGRMKYEEADVELKLTGELEGSLRLLKPEGNLFEDRFKSLQKRNIIEPRLQAKKQKHYKPKIFDRKSHLNVPEVKL